MALTGSLLRPFVGVFVAFGLLITISPKTTQRRVKRTSSALKDCHGMTGAPSTTSCRRSSQQSWIKSIIAPKFYRLRGGKQNEVDGDEQSAKRWGSAAAAKLAQAHNLTLSCFTALKANRIIKRDVQLYLERIRRGNGNETRADLVREGYEQGERRPIEKGGTGGDDGNDDGTDAGNKEGEALCATTAVAEHYGDNTTTAVKPGGNDEDSNFGKEEEEEEEEKRGRLKGEKKIGGSGDDDGGASRKRESKSSGDRQTQQDERNYKNTASTNVDDEGGSEKGVVANTATDGNREGDDTDGGQERRTRNSDGTPTGEDLDPTVNCSQTAQQDREEEKGGVNGGGGDPYNDDKENITEPWDGKDLKKDNTVTNHDDSDTSHPASLPPSSTHRTISGNDGTLYPLAGIGEGKKVPCPVEGHVYKGTVMGYCKRGVFIDIGFSKNGIASYHHISNISDDYDIVRNALPMGDRVMVLCCRVVEDYGYDFDLSNLNEDLHKKIEKQAKEAPLRNTQKRQEERKFDHSLQQGPEHDGGIVDNDNPYLPAAIDDQPTLEDNGVGWDIGGQHPASSQQGPPANEQHQRQYNDIHRRSNSRYYFDGSQGGPPQYNMEGVYDSMEAAGPTVDIRSNERYRDQLPQRRYNRVRHQSRRRRPRLRGNGGDRSPPPPDYDNQQRHPYYHNQQDGGYNGRGRGYDFSPPFRQQQQQQQHLPPSWQRGPPPPPTTPYRYGGDSYHIPPAAMDSQAPLSPMMLPGYQPPPPHHRPMASSPAFHHPSSSGGTQHSQHSSFAPPLNNPYATGPTTAVAGAYAW